MISKYGLAYRAYNKWCFKHSGALMTMMSYKEFGLTEKAKKEEIATNYGLPTLNFLDYVNDARSRKIEKFMIKLGSINA